MTKVKPDVARKILISLVHEQYLPGDNPNRVLDLRIKLGKITNWHVPVHRVANILSHAIQETLHQFNQIVEIKYNWDSDATIWEDVKNKFKWSIAVDETPQALSGYGAIPGVFQLTFCRMAPWKIQAIRAIAPNEKVICTQKSFRSLGC
jgi:hypothetical protein